MKTKANQIDRIPKLNLWGQDISDITIVNEMVGLQVLSLAVNKIQTLKDVINCRNLTELYMRKNNIRNLYEIKYLKNLRQLKILSLMENPMCVHPQYRLYCINQVPSLEKLDDQYVTAAEKDLAMQTDFTNVESPQKALEFADDSYEQYMAQEEKKTPQRKQQQASPPKREEEDGYWPSQGIPNRTNF